MALTYHAYLSVDKVSSWLILAGDRAAIILVFVFPPRAFCNKKVSCDSLKGGATFFPSAFLARAEMTFPRIMRLLLMFEPSLSLSPVAPVLSALSEPARSIKLISDAFLLITFPLPLSMKIYLNEIVVTVCALEEVAFIFVEPMVLLLVPLLIWFSISSYDETGTFTMFST